MGVRPPDLRGAIRRGTLGGF